MNIKLCNTKSIHLSGQENQAQTTNPCPACGCDTPRASRSEYDQNIVLKKPRIPWHSPPWGIEKFIRRGELTNCLEVFEQAGFTEERALLILATVQIGGAV